MSKNTKLTEQLKTELAKPENRHVVAQVNEETGEVRAYMNPVPLTANDKRPHTVVVREEKPTARNANGEREPQFAAPVPYFVTQEMAELDKLRQEVLRLIGVVARSAEGSAEKLAAERSLITVEANYRTALRARESELATAIGAMQRPGADQSELARLQSELEAVRAQLKAVEDDQQGERDRQRTGEGRNAFVHQSAPPASAREWKNAFGETVRMVNGAPRVVK